MRALNDGLGFVRGTCCPHYNGEKEWRPALLRLIKRGFPPTLALDDGAAVHFVGIRFAEAVSSRPEARVSPRSVGCWKGRSDPDSDAISRKVINGLRAPVQGSYARC
jgi:hypothetical protein